MNVSSHCNFINVMLKIDQSNFEMTYTIDISTNTSALLCKQVFATVVRNKVLLEFFFIFLCSEHDFTLKLVYIIKHVWFIKSLLSTQVIMKIGIGERYAIYDASRTSCYDNHKRAVFTIAYKVPNSIHTMKLLSGKWFLTVRCLAQL